MKKVLDVSIGRIKFILEEDAYTLLKNYLQRFEKTVEHPSEVREVMDDVECRIAEIFEKEQQFKNQVITVDFVNKAISIIGDVGSEAPESEWNGEDKQYTNQNQKEYVKGDKQFMRDVDDKMLSGVCSGLAAYFNIDVAIVRLLFVIALIAYGSALIVYIVLAIILPKAVTVGDKLKMRGYAVTTENIRKYNAESAKY